MSNSTLGKKDRKFRREIEDIVVGRRLEEENIYMSIIYLGMTLYTQLTQRINYKGN